MNSNNACLLLLIKHEAINKNKTNNIDTKHSLHKDHSILKTHTKVLILYL